MLRFLADENFNGDIVRGLLCEKSALISYVCRTLLLREPMIQRF